MKKNVIFIDRDGTINVEKKYVHRIEDFEFIPGAIEGLKLLSNSSFDIYIVTNQAGIAKGYYTLQQLNKLNHWLLEKLSCFGIKIKNILFCPHHPTGVVPAFSIKCKCRKPEVLLLENVLKKYNKSIVNLFMVGDKAIDVEAGKRIGAKTFLVRTGYGHMEEKKAKAHFVMESLLEVSKYVVDSLKISKECL